MPRPLSAIPRLGHVHLVDFVREVDADDGFGGSAPTEDNVVLRVSARVSVMTDEDQLKVFGNASRERWWVLSDVTDVLQRSDLMKMNAASIQAPTPRLDLNGGVQRYRLTYLKPQIDHVGGWHHVSLVVEKEDVDKT